MTWGRLSRGPAPTTALVVALIASCGIDAGSGGAVGSESPTTGRPSVSAGAMTTVATGLDVPWGLAFLPDGSALVAERETARVLRVTAAGGSSSAVLTLPGVDTDSGEGGLLGLAVAATFPRDRLVYAYFTSATDNRIVRFVLGSSAAPTPVLTGIARAQNHNGGRIAFGPDGMLYVGTGDAAVPERSQDPTSLNGKILRIRPDGSVPAGNPFPGSPVWSLGHRNVQGLAFDAGGRLWATEFGQNRWDEVNLIRPGRNYGWPVVEGGVENQRGGFAAPLVQWATSEASPSGAAVVGGVLYVAALRGRRLWAVPLDGDRTGPPRALLVNQVGRVRTAVAAPDGSLWIATSNRDGRGVPGADDDRIIRLSAGALAGRS